MLVLLQVRRQIAVLNLAWPGFQLRKYFSSVRVRMMLAVIVTRITGNCSS